MNSPLRICFLIATLLLGLALRAESSEVARIPTGMKWTVEFKPPTSEESPRTRQPTEPTREENESAPGLRKEVRHLQDGSSLTRYAVGDLIVYFDVRSNRVEIDAAGIEAYGGPLSLTEFTELNWVTSALYQGTATIAGVQCDLYVEKLPGAGTAIDPRATKAYINRATRLPVRIENAYEIRDYTFSPLSGALALPADHKEAIEKRAAAIKWRKQRFVNPDTFTR